MSHQSNPYRRRDAQYLIRKVLIVCEGEKTEPNYFKSFQTSEELIKVEVLGVGMNTDSLVQYAVQLKKDAETKKEPYAEVWCVFDRDSFTKNNFNKAIQIAKNNQIKRAYSNEAFEIWYILHFSFHQAAWSRDLYKKKLTGLLCSKYKKNDLNMYAKLNDKQPDAIRHAKQLLENYGANHNPESDNPCTTVHILVEFLNDYIE
ncbi:MAG: RloB family protein [Elusimicrobiota bacterium]